MRKSLEIVIGVVAVAIAGYFVYASYFAVKPNAESAGIIVNKSDVQLPPMPTTDEERIKALEGLNASANPSRDADTSAEDAERIRALEAMYNKNTATSPPANEGISADEAERIKLLEALKK